MVSPGTTWTESAAVPNSPVVASTALSCVGKHKASLRELALSES